MNSKEEQTNSEVNNLENDTSMEKQKDENYINEKTADIKFDEKSKQIWSGVKAETVSYSES